MTDKPKTKHNGWKIYFDADTRRFLEKKARQQKYRSAQDYVHDMVRKEKLKEEAKK